MRKLNVPTPIAALMTIHDTLGTVYSVSDRHRLDETPAIDEAQLRATLIKGLNSVIQY